MAAALTSALLALALAQATGPAPRPGDPAPAPRTRSTDAAPRVGDLNAPPDAETGEPLAPTLWLSEGESDRLPEGVPYMPTVGAPARPVEGFFLDVALLSQLRTLSLATSGSDTTWGTDLEVTPGLALELRTSTVDLTVGYAPRLTLPFETGDLQLAVLNRATFQLAWRPVPTWTLTGLGVFVVGDNSQLQPASTPGGAGPPPPVVAPVRTFQTYPYVGIDTWLRADGVLTPRLRLRVAGGYFDAGGVGEVGLANQPRSWGPQAEAQLAWDASRKATFTTIARAQDSIMPGSYWTLVATVTEAWRQAWTSELETTLAAGPGFANRDIETSSGAGHVVPVASLRLDWRERVRQPMHVGVEAILAPYFDPYLSLPYQRITFNGVFDWRPGDAWQVGASLQAVLAPPTVGAPESYGQAGLSGSYAPVPFLIFTLGGFGQVQLEGSAGGSNFQQWTAYFSVALNDRIAL